MEPVIESTRAVRLQQPITSSFEMVRNGRESPNNSCSESLRNSIMNRLPNELFVELASHLPAVSAISLSLTCGIFYGLIGEKSFEGLGNSVSEKRDLLDLLASQYPNKVACHACRKLHSMENAKRYSIEYCSSDLWPDGNGIDLPARPLCCHYDVAYSNIYCILHPAFSTTIFKMAMKSYQNLGLGQQCNSLLELLGAHYEDRHWKVKFDCVIRNSSLFSRTERESIGTRSFHPGFRYKVTSIICNHISFVWTRYNELFEVYAEDMEDGYYTEEDGEDEYAPKL